MIEDLSFKGLTDFLENCQGFSLLPKDALKSVASQLSLEFHPSGSHLFEENQSKIESVYLLLDGKGEKKWLNANIPHLDNPILEPGEVFGAFSILLNNRWARRSLHLTSDCFFYTLPSEPFLKLCSEFPEFKNHFTSHLSAGTHHESLRGRDRLPLNSLQGHESAGSMANQSVIRVSRKDSIKSVTQLILELKSSIAIVEDLNNPLWGLVTYRTLSQSVILNHVNPDSPIDSIAIREIHSTPEKTPLFQALLLMAQHEVHHLPLTNSTGQVTSILSTRDMPQLKGSGALTLMANIGKTKIPNDLKVHRENLDEMAKEMHHNGFSPHMVSQFIARSNDAIVARAVELIQKDHDLPCPFTFLVFGSEGRTEQTLVVDQDNGILFDPKGQNPEELRPLFLQFGQKVCEALDFIGYPHCKGGVMASEPACCRSLDEWTEAFKDWIDHPSPESVLNAQIYFDLKPVLGEFHLVDILSKRISQHTRDHGASFLHHLAIEVIRHPIPLGFFQNILLSSDSNHREGIDLKNIQNLIVDPIRLWSLKHGILKTNTMERLAAIRENEILKSSLCDDLHHAYENILHLRLLTQENSLLDGGTGSNHLQQDLLGELDRRVLKAILVLTQNIQRKIQRDFDVAVQSI
jgi:CBS domain-containing protein